MNLMQFILNKSIAEEVVKQQGSAISGGSFNVSVVEELPSSGETNTIYFIQSADSTENNVYDEFIYVDNHFEKIGSSSLNLNYDNAPTANSNNLLTSGTIKTALDQKQNVLTIDNQPTENSNNFITSGGVYSSLVNSGSIQVQSDWEQNDNNAVDYIKNRPFYSEPVFTDFNLDSHDYYSSFTVLPFNLYYFLLNDVYANDHTQDPLIKKAGGVLTSCVPKGSSNIILPDNLSLNKEYKMYIGEDLIYVGEPVLKESQIELGNTNDIKLIIDNNTTSYTLGYDDEEGMSGRIIPAGTTYYSRNFYIYLSEELINKYKNLNPMLFSLKIKTGYTYNKISIDYLPVIHFLQNNFSTIPSSKALYDQIDSIQQSLQTKQNQLFFDNYPTKDSQNIVSSNGIYRSISSLSSTITSQINILKNSILQLENIISNQNDQINQLQQRVFILEQNNNSDDNNLIMFIEDNNILSIVGKSIYIDDDNYLVLNTVVKDGFIEHFNNNINSNATFENNLVILTNKQITFNNNYIEFQNGQYDIDGYLVI